MRRGVSEPDTSFLVPDPSSRPGVGQRAEVEWDPASPLDGPKFPTENDLKLRNVSKEGIWTPVVQLGAEAG